MCSPLLIKTWYIHVHISDSTIQCMRFILLSLQDQLAGSTGAGRVEVGGGGEGGGGGGRGGAKGRGPPRVMPVTVPVAQSPGAVTQQIQQVTLYLPH